MKRRTIFKLLLFLLAGAIINVAVAWGCAIGCRDILDDEELANANMGEVIWQVSSFRHPVGDVLVSTRLKNESGMAVHSARHPSTLIKNWSRFEELTAEFTNSERSVVEIRFAIGRGIPMRALWSERSHVLDVAEYGLSNNAIPPINGGIETGLALSAPGPGRWPIDLPLRPIWPGFAINTIFYAAILWVLFAVPGVLSRERRLRVAACGLAGANLRIRACRW
jgi:hypothetical protein